MSGSTFIELTAFQHQLLAGWVAGDPSTHDRILNDGWSVIDPSGNVMSKAEVLSTTFTGEREIDFAEIDQINIRDHGDFAIVTGRTHVRGKLAGQDVNMTLRFTDLHQPLGNLEMSCFTRDVCGVTER